MDSQSRNREHSNKSDGINRDLQNEWNKRANDPEHLNKLRKRYGLEPPKGTPHDNPAEKGSLKPVDLTQTLELRSLADKVSRELQTCYSKAKSLKGILRFDKIWFEKDYNHICKNIECLKENDINKVSEIVSEHEKLIKECNQIINNIEMAEDGEKTTLEEILNGQISHTYEEKEREINGMKTRVEGYVSELDNSDIWKCKLQDIRNHLDSQLQKQQPSG